MNYYSFDIFDTCLTRLCGTSNNLFYLLAVEILGFNISEEKKHEFIQQRMKAESKVRVVSDKDDITIDEIYDEADFSILTQTPNILILQKELEIERRMLIPIYSTISKIRELGQSGYKIIFISDMYLPKSFILNILKQYDIIRDKDSLFVSGELGLSKAKGSLYKYVIDEMGANLKSGDKWFHYGDNLHSDFKMPKKINIKPILVHSKDLPYEKDLNYRYYNDNSILFAQSIVKAIRLSFPQNPHYFFASNFIAPLYTTFTYLLLLQAQKDKMKKLFFLSRDSYIIFRLAQHFSSLFPDIAIKYIQVSRKSLYLPGLKTISVDDLYFMFGDIEANNFFYYTDISNLNQEQYASVIHLRGKALFRMFIEDKKLYEIIFKNWIQQKEITKSYLEQEGLNASDLKCGIVDIRGSRRCQRAINNIIPFSDVKSYYFEITRDAVPLVLGEDYWCAVLSKHRYDGNLLEQYFSITNQKRTIGYSKSTQISPVFEEDSVSLEFKILTSNINEEVCLKFADVLLQERRHIIMENTFNYYVNVFEMFCQYPKLQYLKALIGLKMADSEKQHINYIKKDWLVLARKSSHWQNGSIIYTYGWLGIKMLLLKESLKQFGRNIQRCYNYH